MRHSPWKGFLIILSSGIRPSVELNPNLQTYLAEHEMMKSIPQGSLLKTKYLFGVYKETYFASYMGNLRHERYVIHLGVVGNSERIEPLFYKVLLDGQLLYFLQSRNPIFEKNFELMM